MKIALAHKRLDLSAGPERDFYLTAEGLRDLGHEIHLFCSEFAVEPPHGIVAHKVPVLALGRTARLVSFAFLCPRILPPSKGDLVLVSGRMVQKNIRPWAEVPTKYSFRR